MFIFLEFTSVCQDEMQNKNIIVPVKSNNHNIISTIIIYTKEVVKTG